MTWTTVSSIVEGLGAPDTCRLGVWTVRDHSELTLSGTCVRSLTRPKFPSQVSGIAPFGDRDPRWGKDGNPP